MIVDPSPRAAERSWFEEFDDLAGEGFVWRSGLGKRAGIILSPMPETRKHVLTRENTAAFLLVVNRYLRLFLGLHTAWSRPPSYQS
jgi:hypothetical protein